MRRTLWASALVGLLVGVVSAQPLAIVSFEWDTDADWPNAASAQIERDGTAIAACGLLTRVTSTAYRCSMQQPAGPHTFRVRGLNSAGEPGGWSAAVTGTIPGTADPDPAPGQATIVLALRLAPTTPPPPPPPPPPPSDVALRFVQQAGNFNILGNGSGAFAAPTGAGALLVAQFALAGSDSITAVTTADLTWTRARRQADGVQGVEVWYARDVSGGVARSVAWTLSGGGAAQVSLAEFAGFANGVTVASSGANNGTAATSANAGALTTTAASVLTSVWRSGSGSFSATARGDGFTSLTNGTRALYGYKVSPAGETVDADVTFAAAESGPMAVVAFMPQ